MQFCNPIRSQNWILVSLTSLVLLGGICASSTAAQPLSARTELTSLLDADRLHLNAKDVDYAQSVLDKLMIEATKTNDIDKAASYATDQGLLKLLQNDPSSAQKYCSIGLEARQRICEPTDPKLADSFNALAVVALGEKNPALAQTYARDAIKIAAKDPERSALRLSDSYDIQARAYLDEGNFAKAESPAVQSWKIRTRILGAANPVVAQSLYTLSLYYAQKGDLGNAQSLLQDSILYGDVLQKSNSLLAQSAMYAAQGSIEQARKTFDEGTKLKQAVLGKESTSTSSFKTLYVKYLWNHQHWLDALDMSNSLPKRASAQTLDLDGRLIQRSYMLKEIPQQVILKNMIIVATITVAALMVIALLLFAPHLMYLPDGTGLIEFLRTTRRDDLRNAQQSELAKSDRSELKIPSAHKLRDITPARTSASTTGFPNGKLGFHAELITTSSTAAKQNSEHQKTEEPDPNRD
jgi:tetratricopeptide (TPR) repeat protein